MLSLQAGSTGSHGTDKERIMNKSLRKSVAGAALVAVMALGSAGAASAQQNGPVTTSLPPGGRTCVSTSSVALYQMQAEGSAIALPNQIQWTVQYSRDGYFLQTIASGSDTTFNLRLSYLTSPYFPGYFKFCARNVSTAWSAKATLTLRTDGDVS
jgi:hypothetical protein